MKNRNILQKLAKQIYIWYNIRDSGCRCVQGRPWKVGKKTTPQEMRQRLVGYPE